MSESVEVVSSRGCLFVGKVLILSIGSVSR